MRYQDIQKIVRTALKEDVNGGDITSTLIIPASDQGYGQIISREEAVVSGIDIVKEVFHQLDRSMKLKTMVKDGDRLKPGTVILALKGKTRAILTGERVALNFLGHMSGIATKTRAFVDMVKPYKVKILDTRKTTPGMRSLERYAVCCGGGVNHRFDLYEMVLMKDNHRLIARRYERLSETVRRLHVKTHKKVQIEVDHLWELKEVLLAHPELILLDNMSIAELKKAVALTRKICSRNRPLLEASGGITLKNVKKVASTGVDRISIGALTHSRKIVDMTMELLP